MNYFFVTVLMVFSLGLFSLSAQAARSGCYTTSGITTKISCPYSELQFTGPGYDRTVKYSLPHGRAPKNGWPAVIIYQGSFFPVAFERRSTMPFGGFNEIRLIEMLLDSGFAVIAPNAMERIAWMTNIVGVDYDSSVDFFFISELLESVRGGDFGKLNADKLFATGISSGGYHTSRMAVSFPGVFKALAIESGSYATCGGPMCFVPQALPANHPPTVFLHGRLDTVVPEITMWQYQERLEQAGIENEVYVDNFATHQWLSGAPEIITDWFLNHLD